MCQSSSAGDAAEHYDQSKTALINLVTRVAKRATISFARMPAKNLQANGPCLCKGRDDAAGPDAEDGVDVVDARAGHLVHACAPTRRPDQPRMGLCRLLHLSEAPAAAYGITPE